MGGGGDLEMIRPNGTEWDGRLISCLCGALADI